jgi:hypothetical protein
MRVRVDPHSPTRIVVTGGSFSQCRIYSRYIALQIDAIEAGRLEKAA